MTDPRIEFQRLRNLCESPIEADFFISWWLLPGLLPGLVPAVPVWNGRARLDFAITTDKFGIELDGREYHISPEQFTKDRSRQRELEGAGWRIARFSGAEVKADAAYCVKQAHELWEKLCRSHEVDLARLVPINSTPPSAPLGRARLGSRAEARGTS